MVKSQVDLQEMFQAEDEEVGTAGSRTAMGKTFGCAWVRGDHLGKLVRSLSWL